MSFEIPEYEDPEGNRDQHDEPLSNDLEVGNGVSGAHGEEGLTSEDGVQEFGQLEEPEDDRADEGETLTIQQQTLTVGLWASVCGNCNENAYPDDETHTSSDPDNPACGVRWKYISIEDMEPEVAGRLRPDLTYVEPDRSKDGITRAMEAANESVLEAESDLDDPDL